MYDQTTGMNIGSSGGLLSEHEAGTPQEKKSSQVNIYDLSKEEEQVVKMVNEIYRKNKAHRAKYDKNWIEDYKMFRGEQWKNKRPAYRHSEVINLVFQTIQSTVPQMTDARPKFEFLPQEPQDQNISEILNHLSTSDWEKGGWSNPLLELIYDAAFYGIGYGCVKFDKEALDGMGSVVFESEDPLYVYPDPNAREINDEGRRSRNLCIAKPEDISALKRRYPKFAKYIKADLQDLSKYDRTVTNDDDSMYLSPASDKILLEGSDKFSQMSHRDLALEITVYMKDDTTVTEKQVTTDGQEVRIKRLKYPNGRKIVVVNNIPIVDEEMEYDDKRFPYFKYVNYLLPREFYGISEIEQLKGPQRTFNKLVSFALDVLTLMGNPIWIVDHNSGIDTDNLYNRPGLIVEKNQGAEVRRESGVQLQPYVMNMIDHFKSWFDDVGGSKDVSRGAADGVTAARAIEALQEAANTRVRQKARVLDRSLQEFGQLYASRVFQYYTAPRVFRLTADDGSEQYFRVSMDSTEEGTKVTFNGFNGEKPTEPKEMLLVRDFDVRVTTGSTLTIAKRDHFNKAVSLFDRKAITTEDLLEAAEWPNIPKTLERIQKEQEMMMAQQMQQQMAPQ